MSTVVIVAIVAVVGLLALGGALTKIGPWYRALNKPSWNPPDWLFGPMWTTILGLAGWAGVIAWNAAPTPEAHTRILALFGVNMALHAAWSPLFFMARRPDWSLVESVFLWASVVALIVGLAPYSTRAAWLIAPYIVWVTIATVLNWKIVQLNRPFGRVHAPA